MSENKTVEDLIGRRITEIRPMTKKEMENESWDYGTIVIILDNGTRLYPSMDDEGNGPGALFGTTSEGKEIRII